MEPQGFQLFTRFKKSHGLRSGVIIVSFPPRLGIDDMINSNS